MLQCSNAFLLMLVFIKNKLFICYQLVHIERSLPTFSTVNKGNLDGSNWHECTARFYWKVSKQSNSFFQTNDCRLSMKRSSRKARPKRSSFCLPAAPFRRSHSESPPASLPTLLCNLLIHTTSLVSSSTAS